jgi:hypothetical protein
MKDRNGMVSPYLGRPAVPMAPTAPQAPLENLRRLAATPWIPGRELKGGIQLALQEGGRGRTHLIQYLCSVKNYVMRCF